MLPDSLEAAIAKIHAIANEYCENQIYVWPGFDPIDPDPDKYFRQHRVEFDGELFIRYPVKRTFDPIPMDRIKEAERSLGANLPGDYKVLLEKFGPFHLPGDADIRIQSPMDALRATRACWCYEDKPLSVLAISPYNATSDGNAIGYIRQGDSFGPSIYEFDHELVHMADSPSLWTHKVADCLADFVLDYLDRG